MRIVRLSLLTLLLASAASSAGTGALSLKLVALDPTVKAGAKIMIEVTTTNESDQPITYHNTRRVCDYSIQVLTSILAAAPETAFKKQTNCNGGGLRITGRDIVVTLKPGESDRERIEVTELYDMSAAGEYTVRVERTFPEIGYFRSNAVSVKITQ